MPLTRIVRTYVRGMEPVRTVLFLIMVMMLTAVTAMMVMVMAVMKASKTGQEGPQTCSREPPGASRTAQERAKTPKMAQ